MSFLRYHLHCFLVQGLYSCSVIRLDSEPQGPACLCLPTAGITITGYHSRTFFFLFVCVIYTLVLGTEHDFSCFYVKYFIDYLPNPH